MTSCRPLSQAFFFSQMLHTLSWLAQHGRAPKLETLKSKCLHAAEYKGSWATLSIFPHAYTILCHLRRQHPERAGYCTQSGDT